MRKTLRALVPLALFTSALARAEDAVPPLGSPERIPWAVRCAGPMPALLLAALAAICALGAVALILYRRGGRDDER